MVDRFESRRIGRKDTELVLSKMAKYENFFVRLMMSEQLGSQLTEVDDTAVLIKDASVVFLFPATFVFLYCLGKSLNCKTFFLLCYIHFD